MAETRLLRLCDVCGALDDLPRDVKAVAPGTPGTVPDAAFLDALPDNVPARAVAELMDATTVVRHIGCCAATGCDVCQSVLTATNNAEGADLTAAILSGAVDGLGSPTEA